MNIQISQQYHAELLNHAEIALLEENFSSLKCNTNYTMVSYDTTDFDTSIMKSPLV